jgi:hypothetical protein
LARLVAKTEKSPGEFKVGEWDPRSTARGLCQFAGLLIERGEPLPKPLQDFLVDFLDDPNLERFASWPGPKKTLYSLRDYRIVDAIAHVINTWDFRATRNVASKDAAKQASAASIVRDALERAVNLRLSEDAVNKIWNETASGWDLP